MARAGWLAGAMLGAVAVMGAGCSADADTYKVRVAAARSLARQADAAAVARLGALLADPHPIVRRAAAHALVHVGPRPTAERW